MKFHHGPLIPPVLFSGKHEPASIARFACLFFLGPSSESIGSVYHFNVLLALCAKLIATPRSRYVTFEIKRRPLLYIVYFTYYSVS